MLNNGARGAAGRAGMVLAVLAALVAGSGAAVAQEDEEWMQRCVWQCLANSPGAGSREYDDCVERICVAGPRAQPPAAAQAPGAAWTAGGTARGDAHYAGVEIAGKSFSFLCKRGGPGLLAIAGMGSRTDGVGVRIDRQDYGLPFVSENGVLYTAAPAGSHLLGALMGGSRVEVSRGGASAAFPLAGSGAAIRKALAACGLPS